MSDTDIVEKLRRLERTIGCSDLCVAMTCRLAVNELEQLRVERDEARREVCEAKTDIGFSKPILSHMLEYAVYRGWNCFNKDPMDKIAKLDEEMGLND